MPGKGWQWAAMSGSGRQWVAMAGNGQAANFDGRQWQAMAGNGRQWQAMDVQRAKRLMAEFWRWAGNRLATFGTLESNERSTLFI